MKIRSLGRQTDLIFANFLGNVRDCGSYTLVQTPSNPGYHWGNYIIFDRAPEVGDLKKWKHLFDESFDYYKEPHHYSFTWDTETPEKGDTFEFSESNFNFDETVVLSTEKLNEPPRLNNEIEMRKITTDDEWEEVIKLQKLCDDPMFFNDYYDEYKRTQMNNYRKMTEAQMGHWFGAYLEGKLVGDLGIYFKNKIARYQSVGTHPEFRKRGICGTLVYQSGLRALEEFQVDTLVMEADPDYHAARIYESVGFKKTETTYSLGWWKDKDGN